MKTITIISLLALILILSSCYWGNPEVIETPIKDDSPSGGGIDDSGSPDDMNIDDFFSDEEDVNPPTIP
ncbi:hypothetical protein JW868_03050, partial [Candidatus Woesearchaeota archaeon]|nr:hypothetical protein [Candidatus Woesearchaeota archaeon]